MFPKTKGLVFRHPGDFLVAVENVVRNLVRQCVPQQPTMIVAAIRQPAQFVAYKDYLVAGAEA